MEHFLQSNVNCLGVYALKNELIKALQVSLYSIILRDAYYVVVLK